MKKHLSTIFFVLIFFIGLSVLLYPTISEYWNSFTQSKVISNYKETITGLSEEKMEEMLEQAESYNEKLAADPNAFYNPNIIPGYESILDVTGTGIMGYVTIDRINVELPIYHTVDEAVLQIAVGHMPGTSFPVGGKSTHAVMSGHRGLPSAKLFTDLDRLEEGDIFTITVLNRIITYQVDQIRIVEPKDTESLKITKNEDHCTLFTCTPYGINTHRLLVRGTRIANVSPHVEITSDASQINLAIAVPAVGLPLLTAALAYLVVRNQRTKRQLKLQREALEAMGLPENDPIDDYLRY